MRRLELRQGIEQVSIALRRSGVGETLEILLRTIGSSSRERGNDSAATGLHAFQQYSIYAQAYSPAASEIIRTLNLDDLGAVGFWTDVITQPEAIAPIIYEMTRNINNAINVLPQILKLLSWDALSEVEQGIANNDPQYRDLGLLTATVVETENEHSTPHRVSAMLEGLQQLYDTCTQLLGEPPSEFRVLTCDSGSDQTFTLLGAAKVIESTKDVLLSVWDRMIFFRELQASERQKLVIDELPIFHTITERQEAKQITTEDAARLKFGITSGVEKFLSAKAMIAEMDSPERSHYNPRLLIASERKLLKAITVDEEDEIDTSDSGLTPEEQATLQRLTSKARPKKRPK